MNQNKVENAFQHIIGGEFEKGGEGSKGGKVIGHTKSGKAIYANYAFHPHFADFTPAEHKEAIPLLEGENLHDQAESHDAAAVYKTQQKVKAKHALAKGVDEPFTKAVFDAMQLEKGASGEGSRGGHVIGHTKSGKPIYGGPSASHRKFTAADHSDAAALHDAKAKEATDSAVKARHERMADSHRHVGKEVSNGETIENHYHKVAGTEQVDDFFDIVSKHYEPDDDGESEATMLKNLKKHPKAAKIAAELDKHFGGKGKVEKAFESIVGEDLEKGGIGSGPHAANSIKSATVIGKTKSGKPVQAGRKPEFCHNYTAADHIDAAAAHTEMANANTKTKDHHTNMAKRHTAMASRKNAKAVQGAGDIQKSTTMSQQFEYDNLLRKATQERVARITAGFAKEERPAQQPHSNDLEKSLQYDLIRLGDDSRTTGITTKTGKEIKAALANVRTKVAASQAAAIAECVRLQQLIGVPPDRVDKDYDLPELAVSCYSWRAEDQLCSNAKKGVLSGGDDAYSEMQKNIYAYNDNARVAMACTKQMKYIDVIVTNLDDKKPFKLTVEQLISFGF